MRVLVACEFSGIVRDAFRARGHDAWSCDLLESERTGPHLRGDVLKVKQDWDLMIAFPPCTHLAVSGARWFKSKRKEQVEAIVFVERLWTAGIYQIAIENPVGILSTRSILGKPTQIIQPWQFGHRAQKTTLLWLKGLPPLQATEIVDAGEYYIDKKHGWRHTKWFMDEFGNSKARSKTFEGIAKAIAEQWGAA